MIPKILYTYWGGTKLSWLRYLTVYSFKKYNPEYTIKVFYPKQSTKEISWNTGEQKGEYIGEDYFDKLREIAEVHEFDVEPLGFSNSLPEVHKSGIFRYYMLSNFGGVYCDMDIIFFKPFDLEDTPGIFSFAGYYSDGFLACEKDNPIYKQIYSNLQPGNKGYQTFGISQWYSTTVPVGALYNIGRDYLYHYDSTMIPKLFAEDSKIPESAIGFHWYGGHPDTRQWENLLNAENYLNYKNTITTVIKEVLKCQ